jgi:hypothetical protein
VKVIQKFDVNDRAMPLPLLWNAQAINRKICRPQVVVRRTV